MPFNPFGGYSEDAVIDMATDQKGNVYVMSYVASNSGSNIDIDGHVKKGFDGTDVAISSFKCDGTFRWMKIIGVISNCAGISLKTDTLGGVYAGLFFYSVPSYLRKIDTDTTLAVTSQSMMLLKYDTAGNYKWLRLPESSTISYFAKKGRATIQSMDVKGNGEISLLSLMTGGDYANGAYTVSDTNKASVHMLKYNASGSFIKGYKMEIEGDYDSDALRRLKMLWDTKRDKYIIYGVIYHYGPVSEWDTLQLGSSILKSTGYVSEFDNSGKLKWLKQNAKNTGGFKDAAIDRFSNIYLLGGAVPGDTFNTYVFKNSLDNDGVGFISKMDSSGNHIWAQNSSNLNSTSPYSIALVSDTLMCSIANIGSWKWSSSVSLTASGNCLLRINANSGSLIRYDTLTTGVEISKIVPDRFGNFYCGGIIKASPRNIGSTTLTIAGGPQDFVLAQFGFGNCSTPIIDKPVSISESSLAGTIKIYPNPVNDRLVIEGAENGTRLSIYNMVGQQLSSQKASGGINEISTSALSPGMYIVHIVNIEGYIYSSKILKQ